MGGSQSREEPVFEQLLLDRYTQSQPFQHPALGEIRLLIDRQDKIHSIYCFQQSFPTKQDLLLSLARAEKRTKKDYLLLRLHISHSIKKSICSSSFTRVDYFQYCKKSLADLITENLIQRTRFSKEYLLKLAKFLLTSLEDYHGGKMFFRTLSPASVLIGPLGTFKLVDYQACNPYAVCQAKQLVNEPLIAECHSNNISQVKDFDPFKLDVWCAGLIILQACTLNPPSKSESHLQKEVKQASQFYGSQIELLLLNMLERHYLARSNPSSLIRKLRPED